MIGVTLVLMAVAFFAAIYAIALAIDNAGRPIQRPNHPCAQCGCRDIMECGHHD